MNFSSEQLAIFDFFRSGAGNLIVEARAGTGKTTTIKEAFGHAPENRILYAVFNKRNQKEAEEKIQDPRVEVKTLHSLGYAFIRRVWGNAKPDDDVESDRVESSLRGFRFESDAQQREVFGAILKLVAFAKNTTINTTPSDLRNIAESQDIYVEGFSNDVLFESAMAVMEASKAKDSAGRISFNDMVWLPVVMSWVREWYDLVCVDEAQDMNLPQLTMAKLACKKSGRVVVVGDDRQAIYGFRGAVQNGMTMMRVSLKAAKLGLTTTYRCPKSVVQLAQAIVPDYNAAPEAPEGLVQSCNETLMAKTAKPGDAILSRLNAPLMPIALSLIRANIPARIEGRDVGNQLITMVRTLRAKTVEQFIVKLDEWAKKQAERLMGRKNAEKRLEQVNDIAQTLSAVAEGADSVSQIEHRLTDLFQDSEKNSKPAVVLSSVHKAKGLEWNRVFMLAETFRRGKGQEEDNIYYVAATRAKRELYLVAGGKGQQDEKPCETTPEPEKPATNDPGAVSQPPSKQPDSWDLPPGSIFREPGCVFSYGGSEYVSVRLSDCNSKAVCLKKSVRTIKYREPGTMEEKEKQVESAPAEITVSRQIDKADLVRRLSPEELNDFLNRSHRSGNGKQKTSGGNNNTESTNSMKKKTKKTESGGANRLDRIVEMAKEGKTQDQIAKAITKEFGEPTPATLYLIGREWRRANGALRQHVGHLEKGEKPATKSDAQKAIKEAAKPEAKKPAKAAAKTPAPKAPKTPEMPEATPPPKSTPPPRPEPVQTEEQPAE